VNDLIWSQYRGPEGNGASDEEIAPLDWSKNPPKELWRISIGPGWGSFAYNNQKLFTQEQRGEKEHVTCYSAADGRPIWTHADETRFNEVVSGAGPRSTPSVANGHVYALGGTGLLTCLNELDGTVVWQKNLVTDFGAPIPMWGFSSSPLILDDKLIIFAGGPGTNGLLALECATGSTLWGFPSTDMNYTTARPMTLCGQSIVVFCDGKGTHAIDPKDGSAIWTFKPELWKGPAMVDPQQIGPESLLVGLGDGVGTARLEISKTDERWTVTEAWSSTKLRPSFNDSVVFDNGVYGFNQAIFSCIDAKTGERKWQGGRYGFGQAVLLKKAGQILVAAENGDLVLLQATPEKLTELSRLPMLNDKTWNHPIVAGKRLFLRNGKTAVCLQLVE
jgi:outer membrane protein assembly factor BamB